MKTIFRCISCCALVIACGSQNADAGDHRSLARKASKQCTLPEMPTRVPVVERIVAVGDLHGDLKQTLAVLKLAGLIDDAHDWTGGKTVLVQTGDILDRGNDEPEILDLLGKLKSQAQASGGSVYTLNGNHEVMNAAGDFRYVTVEGFRDFSNVRPIDNPNMESCEGSDCGRAAAFLPGGPRAKQLARNYTALIVGDTLFVHGGIRPAVSGSLEKMNRDIRCWLDGQIPMPNIVNNPDGPLWSRAYSEDLPDCKELAVVLSTVGAKTMVVGHTVQPDGISSACRDQVWRIDVGLSEHYGGKPEALEITAAGYRILR